MNPQESSAIVWGQKHDLLPPLSYAAPKDPLLPIAIKEDEWYDDGVREDMGKKLQDKFDHLENVMKKSKGVDDYM